MTKVLSRLSALPIAAAWLMFVVSFFLPATNVVSRPGTSTGAALSGWEALYCSLLSLAAQPLIVIVEPRSLLFLTFPFINLAMLLLPSCALADRDLAPWFGVLLIPPAFIPLLLPKTLTGDLFIGFYVWILSFFAMAAGCFLLGLSSYWSLCCSRDRDLTS